MGPAKKVKASSVTKPHSSVNVRGIMSAHVLYNPALKQCWFSWLSSSAALH